MAESEQKAIVITAQRPTNRTENTLDGFLKSFGNKDIARPNRFQVIIPAPQGLLSEYKSTFSNLTYHCEMAHLPSRTFGTVDQKFGANPTQKFPLHSSYNDLQLTFIVSGDMTERTLFDVWMEYINPTNSFDFNYKKSYAVSLQVIQYDVFNKPSYISEFRNAYPVSVNQMDLDWSSEGVHKLTVDFVYDYWTNAGIAGVSLPNSTYTPLSSIDFGDVFVMFKDS